MATDPGPSLCGRINGAAEQIVVGEGMNECFSSGARGRGFFNFRPWPRVQPFHQRRDVASTCSVVCAWNVTSIRSSCGHGCCAASVSWARPDA